MGSYVLDLRKIDKTKLALVGGKGLNLGELSGVEGVRVPEGFCITTGAYKKVTGCNEEFGALLEQLAQIRVDDREKTGEICDRIRRVIEGIEIPAEMEDEIIASLARLGAGNACAVRSSATAEDLPLASFAGQQNTYLNVKGKDAILQHVRKCWASLFTERAVIYRGQKGFDHRGVYMSVIIQRMIFPQAAGILFTADPVTFNRKVLSIDAGFGLGEALVSGLVNADMYKVREGRIIDKRISAKKLAVYPSEKGGTEEREIEPGRQNKPVLADEHILRLERLGRKIEAYFGCPQDVEWCLAEDTFFIVQSRPITTLFPVPDGHRGENRVYLSVGHGQMMTDAIRPLGMSFFEILSGDFPLCKAGGRLFIDLTHDMASPLGRRIVLGTMGSKGDPLMRNAILSLMRRRDFIKSLPRGKRFISIRTEGMSPALILQAIKIYRENDPAMVQSLISCNRADIENLRQRIKNVSGDKLFDFILQDRRRFKEVLYDPRSMGAILVGMYAAYWINKKMEKWLGEKSLADTLSQSVPNNITSEMGLALLDVADVVRRYPAVIEYFHHAASETFFQDLVRVEGGRAVSESIQAFLAKYGMRCPGEIDITRTRWNERPTALIPMILNNIKNFPPGARSARFKRGLLEAERKERELLKRLEQLPGGKRKAQKTRYMISLLRNFTGYREYPKYFMIWRFWIYKQALLREAAGLVRKGVIPVKEDIYYLSFEELREVVRTNRLDYSIITGRKEEYRVYEKLTPPRVMTSEGEIIRGGYNTGNIPRGALPGIPVSAGVIEGRARVVLDMADAGIEEGDILVTRFTDPSWTPLFVSVRGLVTEVGGLMTHGAVIAREYGLPAVVSVEDATKIIKDGQKIRVNGTAGYVEILIR